MKRLCLALLFVFVTSAPSYAALSYTEAQIDTLLGIVNTGTTPGKAIFAGATYAAIMTLLGAAPLASPTFTGSVILPSDNADPAATAGSLVHDSTVAGLLTGALAWYDGDENRYIVDLDVLPSNDAYVVAYSAGDDKFYMKLDATGGGTTMVDDTMWANVGDIAYATGNDAGAVLAAGAQGTLLMGNGAGAPSFLAAGTSTYMMIAAGADDPVWSTPAAVKTNLGLDVVDSTDATTFVLITDTVTGELTPKTDLGITYDATTGIGTITGGWSVPATATGPQSGTMLEDSDNGSNFVGIGAPASVTNDLVLLIPGTADPLLGQILTFAVPTSVIGSDSTARDSTQASWIYRQAAQDPIVGDPDDFDTAFTLANLYGGTHICSAAGQADFPATATGMNFTIKNEGNFALVLHPYSGDKIYLDMNDLTTDVTATCAEDALIYCQYRSANAWSCDTYNCVVTP